MNGSECDGADDAVPVEVGDRRKKHVRVDTLSGTHVDHGDVFFRYSTSTVAVSPDESFAEATTTRYRKEDLRRVEVTQHHAACFIATATADRPSSLSALRGFRDDAMARTQVGRALVRLYYAVSPPIAATLARHPRARTTRAVRWLVERCADLATWRSTSRSPPLRLAASVLLTLAYAVGVGIALGGHGVIRLREALGRGDSGGGSDTTGPGPTVRNRPVRTDASRETDDRA